MAEEKKPEIVIKPVVRDQQEWVAELKAKADFIPPSEKRRQVRRFVAFQSKAGDGLNTLTPPIYADPAYAESFAKPGRYPVFEDGDPEDYEDTVDEVVSALEMDTTAIAETGAMTAAQAAALREELQEFRQLAKEANAAQYRARRLAFISEENRGAALTLDRIIKAGDTKSQKRMAQAKTPEEVQEAVDEILATATPEMKQALGEIAQEQQDSGESAATDAGADPDAKPPKRQLSEAQLEALAKAREAAAAKAKAEREAREEAERLRKAAEALGQGPAGDEPDLSDEQQEDDRRSGMDSAQGGPMPPFSTTPEEDEKRLREQFQAKVADQTRAEQQLFDRELTAKERQQILAAKSDFWADKATDEAKEAKKAAIEAARKATALRKKLEKMHGMVKDAALTAEALPDDRDDAAKALVAEAQEDYAEAYKVVNGVYRGGGGATVALDWAFYLEQETKDAALYAEQTKRRVDNLPGQGLSKKELQEFCEYEAKTATRQLLGSSAPQLASRVPGWYAGGESGGSGDGVYLTADWADLTIPEPDKNTPDLPQDPPGLRPYQKIIMEKVEEAPKNQPTLVAAPTGAGKTRMLAHYIKEQRKQGKVKKVVVMAHTEELIKQLREDIEDETGVLPGKVQGKAKGWNKADIVVVSHGSVVSNPNSTIPANWRNPDLMIIDEAHHAASDGYGRIIKAFNPGQMLGFTATPYRHDKKRLVGIVGDPPPPFRNLICTLDTGDLINQGYLVKPTIVDVNLTGPDGETRSPKEASNLPELYEDAVNTAIKNGRRKILVFVSGAESDDELATSIVDGTTRGLRDSGLVAGRVLGNTPKKERMEIVDRFVKSDEGVLVNFGTLNEGFDAPDIDAIVLGRDIGSRGTLAQIVGRGLRRPNNKKKDVLLLNMGDKPADVLEDMVYNQTKSVKGSDGCTIQSSTPPQKESAGGTGNYKPTPAAKAAAPAAMGTADMPKRGRAGRPRRRGAEPVGAGGPSKLPDLVMSRG